YTAVVQTERDFPQGRHLSPAHFVQDFAGLGIGSFIDFRSLMLGQELEDALRHGRRQPQTLKSGDDAISSEHGAEPGHSGVGITRLGVAMNHHLEIGKRPTYPIVKLVSW